MITAIHEKQKRGEFIGAYAPYGYMRSEQDPHKLVIDKDTASIVKDIFNQRAEGVSYTLIARSLNAQKIPTPTQYRYQLGIFKKDSGRAITWQGQAIKKIVHNPIYIGHMAQGKTVKSFYDNMPTKVVPQSEWVIVENTHEPLIDKETYQCAQTVNEERYQQSISSDDANEGESDSIINQRDLLYDFLNKSPELRDAIIEEFVDDGYSGKTFDRPAMEKLLAKVAQGEVNCILVKDFSRFGRNHLEAGKYLETIFPFYNVRFISVNDLFDSSREPYGTSGMEVALKNLIHETYIRDISDKIRSVQRYKMKKGEYICAIAPFGYVKSKTEKNKLEIDPDAAETVRYIFQLACEGNRPTAIANMLNAESILTPLSHRKKNNIHQMRGWTNTQETNIWTDCIVRRILQDRRFTGDMVGHRSEKADVLSNRTVQIPESERIIVPNTHEAIVSREVFDLGKSIIKKMEMNKYAAPSQTLFSRLLKCGHCEHMLSYKKTKQPYYICRFDRFSFDKTCSCRIDEALLARAVLSILINEGSFCDDDRSNVQHSEEKNTGKEVSRLNNLISDQESLLNCIIADYSKGNMAKDIFSNKRWGIHNMIEDLSKRKMALMESLQENGAQSNEVIRLSSTNVLTRADLEKFIKVIFVFSDNTIEIVWNDKLKENVPERFLICGDGNSVKISDNNTINYKI